MQKLKQKSWFWWGLFTLLVGAFLTYKLTIGDKGLFLVGKTTDGHHQIELACSACHLSAFASPGDMQKACVKCHGAALKAVDDSHPRGKFTDPRNAEFLAHVDARLCVSCHREHREEITGKMGATLPKDFCFYCHEDIAKERPSHADMKFSSCDNAGCHNYHDNSALYEDFLYKHRFNRNTRRSARIPGRNYYTFLRQTAEWTRKRLGQKQHDAPKTVKFDADLLKTWSSTAHARTGVNCSDCHIKKNTETKKATWSDHPGSRSCPDCHKKERDGFESGKHGMRLAQGLEPMSVNQARRAMSDKARKKDKSLTCNSCHSAHRFNTRTAAVDSCLGCHDDEHTKSYKASPHYALWRRELNGFVAAGSGVNCATCHMPRTVHKRAGRKLIRVEHNQNRNFQPNEGMIRNVCLRCHGLSFSINALADPALIKNNFNGKPSRNIGSMDMAIKRIKTKGHKKKKKKIFK